ncbi:MAG: NADH-quinone oxidoreductase subunit NuoH [Chloroflexi bacterium]|nr:NADH-quinone oxidoreductase subunit NuoH [Chloroflexota bacterium]
MDILKLIYDPFGSIGEGLRGLLTQLLVQSLGLPDWTVTLIMLIAGAGFLVAVATVTMMFLTWLERKVIARMQDRLGPNRAGLYGILQPVADMVKLFTKEDITPSGADRVIYNLSPMLVVLPSLLVFAVVPFANHVIISDLSIGFLYIVAIGSTSTIALLMGGWGSNNKYALLGGMRAVAQFVSYEIPQVLSVVGVLLLTGSLSLGRIVYAQNYIWFAAFQPVAFIIFLLASVSEANRTPFDLPEAESEIIAGYHVEYSGIKFALYFLAEYINTFAISVFATTIFLGGWQGPYLPGWGALLPDWLWFLLKSYAVVFVMIWMRGTLPRLRIDQLMNLAWKALVPLALVNLLLTGVGLSVMQVFGWKLNDFTVFPSLAVFLVLNVLMGAGFLAVFKPAHLPKRKVVLVSRSRAFEVTTTFTGR